MNITTVTLWVMCALNTNSCIDVAGSVARQTHYSTPEECFKAAQSEQPAFTTALSCKPRTELRFEFTVNEGATK